MNDNEQPEIEKGGDGKQGKNETIFGFSKFGAGTHALNSAEEY